jgi:squalene-hopene/tetraprenyl-beta-curcumene cyclase
MDCEPELISSESRSTVDRSARRALDAVRDELLQRRTPTGFWVGELSPSALSTATAISAISTAVIHGSPDPQDLGRYQQHLQTAISYLSSQQNEDGGFGDTDRSYSNIATSYLVLAATVLARQAADTSLSAEAVSRLQRYLEQAGGIEGLRRRYGQDKTFVVPILTNLAIAGLVPWREVARLPFEAAVFPQTMYRWLQMPVVSYAIPALVAIGQARHLCGPKTFWPLHMLRSAAIGRTMNVLLRMQPASGGYLEATPLTSFVCMSLAATGRGDHPVCRNGLKFLVASMNSDGSWPIDTNLATWLTSLAIQALACDPEDDGQWCRESLVEWHLGCQHKTRHPFTAAEPGGWGWTDLSGAVPDSDDTPAAIMATQEFCQHVDGALRERCEQAIVQGVQWLHRLQNRDGGWPTFCRGWGKLPFDRSSNDLTAHVLRAVLQNRSWEPQRDRVPDKMIRRGVEFLHRNQRADGAWLPLWFGNQDQPNEINPVYGTSRVLLAGATGVLDQAAVRRGCEFLIQAQNHDGGWGGGPAVSAWLKSHPPLAADVRNDYLSSVEETALAVDALVANWDYQRNQPVWTGVEQGPPATGGVNHPHPQAIIRGIEFLVNAIDDGRHRVAWPIGFYFAKLWYHEELYPLIFATKALANYLRSQPHCRPTSDS